MKINIDNMLKKSVIYYNKCTLDSQYIIADKLQNILQDKNNILYFQNSNTLFQQQGNSKILNKIILNIFQTLIH